jgi:hypothetical protein
MNVGSAPMIAIPAADVCGLLHIGHVVRNYLNARYAILRHGADARAILARLKEAQTA